MSVANAGAAAALFVPARSAPVAEAASGRLPKVHLTEATTNDSNSVTVDYTISGASVTSPIVFDVYRSRTDSLSGTHELLGATTIAPSMLNTGAHSAKLISDTSLVPDTKMEYVIVTADQSGAVAEAAGSTNSAYFQILMLGAISHGEADPLSSSNATPAWEITMRAGLIKDDGFNNVIAFNWMAASRLPVSGQAVKAGNQLETIVVAKADQMAAAHRGDVVDLSFIGHSRGTVVVSEAIQDLVGTKNQALVGSYITETQLDAHPANTNTLNLYSGTAVGEIAIYQTFEALANDPAVTIPANVDSAQVYYQHTPYSDFSVTDPQENEINLWGEGPSDGIVNKSSVPITWHDLTGVDDDSPFIGTTTGEIGWIGHSEMTLWYIVHVADSGQDV